MSSRTSFPVAPSAEKNHGALGMGMGFWFVCHDHKLKWWAGWATVNGSLKWPQRAYWRNEAILSDFEHVGPEPGPMPPLDSPQNDEAAF